MRYNLASPVDVARFLAKVNYHVSRKTPRVELVEKRTVAQNSYLHLIIGWLALETGNTLDFVKQHYYKRLVNPATFVREKNDRLAGRVEELRGSADLTTAEMTLTIERFRNWAAMEAGIHLPEPNEHEFLRHIQNEIEKHQQWI
jgi:hypothetical protein